MKELFCQCHYPMHLHYWTDEINYLAYSENQLEKIKRTADKNGKILVSQIENPDFRVWKCPSCGRLLVFDEVNETSVPAIYTREYMTDKGNLTSQDLQDKELSVVSVQFSEFGKEYTYLCDNESIRYGDWVVVPVGVKNEERIALVNRVYKTFPYELTYPADKLKSVIKKHTIFKEEIAYTIRQSLLKSGKLLDFTSKDKKNQRSGRYDILKTPMGYFWLELNDVPIVMSVIVGENTHSKYRVNGLVFISPEKMQYRDFLSLELCADFDIDAARWIDEIAEECVAGNSWEKDGIQFGITVQESHEFEDELATRKYSRVPLYATWHDSWAKLYGFHLAWKTYESDEDLSIDFYTT